MGRGIVSCAALSVVCLVVAAGCGKSPADAPAAGAGDGKPAAETAAAAPAKAGAGMVKLSKYDAEILPPSIAVAADGTIHVAFVERMSESPFTFFVFHRSSKDNGATWSEAKNLSEDMPGVPVGTCRVLVDGRDRVYVVWRTGLKSGFPVTQTPAGGGQENLVYRVLDNGKWSKIKPINKPGSPETQDDGAISYVACVDADGNARVFWNVLPDRFHTKDVMRVDGTFTQHLNGIGAGLIFEATLDGASTTPKEFYSAPVKTNPADPIYGKSCDDLNLLDAYADKSGPHLLARRIDPTASGDDKTHVALIENGKHADVFDLAVPHLRLNGNPPRLLVDAKGRRHAIAFNEAAEHPCVRDEVLGGDEEPTVILAAQSPGTVLGFQAFGGPGGRMATLIQTTEHGYREAGDTWLSTSDGGPWSKPVCLTGNATKASFKATQTGALAGVASGEAFGPGPGAIAFDKAGHPLLALVNVRVGSFGQSAGGVVYASGSSSSPQLFFVRP